MTASDDYVDTSSSDYTSYSADPAPPVADIDAAQYSVNNKITAVTIVALFIFVFFISSLQIYVKWRTWWRWSPQRSNGEAATAAAAAAAKARTGLDKATIALLPTFVYKQNKFTTLPHGAGDEEEGGSIVYNQLECAVCLSEFQENEKGRMLPSCKHSFHIECIDMWFYSHPTCPLCRTMVKPGDQSCPSSASPPIMEEQAQGQVELGNAEASEDDMVSTRPASTNALDNGITTYPTDQTLALLNSNSSAITSSKRPSPSSCTPYPLRNVPHITIEIPAGQDDGIHSQAGCLSLSSRRSCRCPSPFEQACSTSLKSPGLQVSLKRMLSSKGRRVSNQEGSVESPKETNNLPL